MHSETCPLAVGWVPSAAGRAAVPLCERQCHGWDRRFWNQLVLLNPDLPPGSCGTTSRLLLLSSFYLLWFSLLFQFLSLFAFLSHAQTPFPHPVVLGSAVRIVTLFPDGG